MKTPNYADYVALIMQMIYFADKARNVLDRDSMMKIDEVIQILRFWAQFEKPNTANKKRGE